MRTAAATRRTRVVATIGPASASDDVLEALLAAGMDAARVNFSHGEPFEQAAMIRRLRLLGRDRGRPLAVIADLPGPKLRIGEMASPMPIAAGQNIVMGAGTDVPVTDPSLLAHLRPGDRVLVDDGAVAFGTLSAGEGHATLRALNDGVVGSRKGINLPETSLPVAAFTARDRELLGLALEAGADHVALSFVRSAGDVADLRATLDEAGSAARIIAKIEKREALANLEEIVAASDAVMVARGDLGVEISPTEVPLWQKAIIGVARRTGRPVIIATQMLQSMVTNPRPTRAEASDVANAILDSVDAVMLSAETAVGAYSIDAVRTMAEIAEQAERGLPGYFAPGPASADARSAAPAASGDRETAITRAISLGACDVADGVGAAAIVTSTLSGRTARTVARLRPRQALVALSTDPQVLDQLALCWGVTPLRCRSAVSLDEIVEESDRLVVQNGLCAPGDPIVITAGFLGLTSGTTNLIKAHTVR